MSASRRFTLVPPLTTTAIMSSIVKSVVHWGSHPRVQSPSQSDLCEICGKKPKFVEGGFKHPYCSRSCARNGQGPSPTACVLHGCRATGKPAFAGFCSEAHGREGVRLGQAKGCDQCNVQPRTNGDLCITCDRRLRSGPRLREVNVSGTTFKTVRDQFVSRWQSAGASSVERVYEVIISRDVRVRYDTYRAKYATAEEIRTFHSSQCICDLGSKDAALCSFKSCGICNIIKSSFKAFAFGVPFNTGRFGDGIYSYKKSSLADQFATSCTSSPYRVMIACDVLLEPHQSPTGRNATTDDESIFVTTPDAIIPRYVIMYTK